jgi:molecular chaperone DnaK (HSP70)
MRAWRLLELSVLLTGDAQIISGEETLKDILMMDVNPLTLGIETVGGVMVCFRARVLLLWHHSNTHRTQTKLIPRNTGIPTVRPLFILYLLLTCPLLTL